MRQRVRARTSPLAAVGRLLVLLLALALVWYGAMLVALAFKAPPDTINAISGYRSAYDWLAGLGQEDVTGRVRAIAAALGLAGFLVFGYLAWKQIPRPYLERGEYRVGEDGKGSVTVEPRAIERVAEGAASGQPGVSEASARYGARGVVVDVTVDRSEGAAETLRDVQRRVTDALRSHELGPFAVSVALTRFDRRRRELST